MDIINKINIPPRSQRLLEQLLEENPEFASIIRISASGNEANERIGKWVRNWLKNGHELAIGYLNSEIKGREAFENLQWNEVAAIRILDYISNAGRVFDNMNRRIKKSISDPFGLVWLSYHHGKGGCRPDFFMDLIHLFRQFSGIEPRVKPSREEVQRWMDRHSTGLDPAIIKMREENKTRILNIIIRLIETGKITSSRYNFPMGLAFKEKMDIALGWWEEYPFHLKFAIRTPELLNEMLNNSLDPDTMNLLKEAKEKDIPFFINPYYLSLLNVNAPNHVRNSDLAIRDYVLYSKELIREFGSIVAWEKEDKVEPGKPNFAGWLLPNDSNIHRRYPEAAILIPDTAGRACGGLCVSCQRMYNFQRGRLNFSLGKLKPGKSWNEKLIWLMGYFENDSQLRDILITGGDAFMSSDRSLKHILDEIYNMAVRKKEANSHRKNGEKYSEIVRVRLGTRLPVYIPQRITDQLIEILVDFRKKAEKIGIKQFIIQTHFLSPMEVTPIVREAVKKLTDAGWLVVNQLVFTAAASRRGFAAKLRKVLNDIGILNYYTFTVKGFMENHNNFANNSRAIQEQVEEKILGSIPDSEQEKIKNYPSEPKRIVENINKLRDLHHLPFLATDRNVMNLPGVGKSLTFRTIGLTWRGRRILEFDHDVSRNHSPIISSMGKVTMIESKTIMKYLQQMEDMGENLEEYYDVWGYSMGETEARPQVFEYPEYNYRVTEKITNLQL